MPSSIDRSATAENASLPEVTTTPLTAASADVCFTISSNSKIVVSSSTFIERPGMFHVTSAMPSASVSTLKFLKAIGRSLSVSIILRWPRGFAGPSKDVSMNYPSFEARASPSHLDDVRVLVSQPSHSFDDGRGTHAAADAQRDQRGRLVAALELVEHGAENHRPRRP